MKKVYILLFALFFTFSSAKTQISFVPDQTFACLPVTINFTNNSSVGDTYFWSFGDNGQSTTFGLGSGSSHTYFYPGTFTISIQAYQGSTFLGMSSAIITIEGMPTYLNITDSTICPGDEIAIDVGSGSPTNISWDFGDGTVLNNTEYSGIRHQYMTAGNYTINVSADFPSCGTQSRSRTVDVGNYPLSTNYPLNIWVQEDSICPGDLVIIETPYAFPNYYTSFGDGSNAYATNTHVYQGSGVYPINVTVFNGCGNSAVLTDTVYILNGLPADVSSTFNITQTVACINTSIDLSFPSYPSFSEYYWDFGNGNVSSSQSATISYPTPGQHTFALTLTNGCGNSQTIIDTISISNNIPVTGLMVELPYLTELCPGDGFFLTAEVDNGREWHDFHWDFGDGNTADEFYIQHSYQNTGTYIVSLTATNFCGNSATVSDTVTIGNSVTPDPQFYQFGTPQDNPLYCPGDSVSFIFGPGSATASIEWDFGDGDSDFATNFLVVQGQTYNYVNHAYSAAGSYNAQVTYTNSCGNSFTQTVTIEVTGGVQPDPNLFEDPLVYNCQGQPVQFIPIGGITYIWDFGDGSGNLVTHSTITPIEHTFVNAGTYNVSVEVFNACGLSATTELEVVIPESLLEITTNSIDASCTESDGKAIAVVDGGTTPYSYQWSNGDMSFMADSIPAGIYVVNVEDKNGCKNFAIATVSDAEAPTILTSAVVDVNCHGENSGAIDISIIGGSAPYSYVWSNGSVSQDVNQLEAGPHEITVTDANGCIGTESIVVEEPGLVLVTALSQNADCGMANGEAAAAVSGTTGPYNFLWSNGSTGQLVTGLSAGIYDVVVVDNNGCIFEESVAVSEGNLHVILDSITGTGCTGDLASIYIKILPGGNYSYDWNNGATTEDISNLSTGLYSVEVTDINNSCVGYAQFAIDDIPTASNDLCLVTVDSISNTNRVIWEKDLAATNISHYNVYKESSQSGVYYLVDQVPYDSLSVWVDPVSNPQVRAWRYKLSVVDDCGNESEISSEHKTIHLTVNEGINNTYNLIWDHYDGLTYSTYEVYRRTNASGWQLIATLPSNLNSYTDATPPAGTEYYRVEALTTANCDPTRAGVNTSRSNVKNTPAAPPFGQDVSDNEFLELVIYPNPSSGIFMINPNNGNKYSIEVYNAIGENIYSSSMTNEFILDLSNYSDGMYFVQLKSENSSKTIKLIKQ